MRSVFIVPGDYAAALASGADALIGDAASPPRPAPRFTCACRRSTTPTRSPPSMPRQRAGRAASCCRSRREPPTCNGLARGWPSRKRGSGSADGAIRVLAMATESPQAIFGLPSYRGASSRLEGLIWSVSPLDAALGARSPSRAAGPLRLARDLTLLAARAAGVWALDAPYDLLDDLDGLRAEAVAAHADGFDGKVALSAAQVAVINEVFG